MSGEIKNELDKLAQSNAILAQKIVILTEQGYLVNRSKLANLNLGVILFHLYKSCALGCKELAKNIKHIHNKLAMS